MQRLYVISISCLFASPFSAISQLKDIPHTSFSSKNNDSYANFEKKGVTVTYPTYYSKVFWIGNNGRKAPKFIFPDYGEVGGFLTHTWCYRHVDFNINYKKNDVAKLAIDPQKEEIRSVQIIIKTNVYNEKCSLGEEGVNYNEREIVWLTYERPEWYEFPGFNKGGFCSNGKQYYELYKLFSVRGASFYLDIAPSQNPSAVPIAGFRPKDLAPGKHTLYALKWYDNGEEDSEYGSHYGPVEFPFEFEILQNPTIELSSTSNAFCSNEQAVTLQASPAGGYWIAQQGDGVSREGVFDPFRALIGQNILTYHIIHPNGCTDQKELCLTVNQASTINIANYPSSFCKNASPFQFKASPEGGNWSGQGIDQYGIFSPRNAPLQASKLAYSYQRADNGCVSEQEIPIEIKDSYDITITSHDPTICSNAYPLQLMANPRGGTWSGSSISATGALDPSKASLGDNELSYSITHPSGCSSKETTHIRILEASVILLNNYPKFFCSNSNPFQFQVSPEGGTWTGQGINQHGLFNPRHAPLYRSSLLYSYTRPDNQCYSAKRIEVEVSPIPDDLAIAGHKEGCQGDRLQLTANPTKGTYKDLTYHWMHGHSESNYKQGKTITHTIARNEKLVVLAKNAHQCVSTNKGTIDIKNFSPIVQISADKYESSTGSRIQLAAKTGFNPYEDTSQYTYYWKLSNGNTFYSKNPYQWFHSPGKISVALTTTSSSQYGCQTLVQVDDMLTILPEKEQKPNIGGGYWENYQHPKNQLGQCVVYPSPYTTWLKLHVELSKPQIVKFWLMEAGTKRLFGSWTFQGQQGENDFFMDGLIPGAGSRWVLTQCEDFTISDQIEQGSQSIE